MQNLLRTLSKFTTAVTVTRPDSFLSPNSSSLVLYLSIMKASSWPKASKEWTSESIWMVCGIICGMGFVLHCFKLDILVNLLYTTGVNGKEQSLPEKMPIFQCHWRQPDSGISDLIWSMTRVGGVGHPRRCPSPLGNEAGWTAGSD